MIPLNDYGRIVGCSGLTLKHGICIGTGMIVFDFRGIVALLSYEVNVADHIAQMIFRKYETVKFVELTDSKELPKTERDSNGFGSSAV